MAKIAERIYECNPCKIVENSEHPQHHLVGESIFSLANEYMGVRGYAEEGSEGPSLIGSYFGGVYEWGPHAGPGGYKGIVKQSHAIVCAADYFYVRLLSDGQPVMMSSEARQIHRELDLKTGALMRSYQTTLPGGGRLKLCFERLIGMDHWRCAAQRITLTAECDTELQVTMAIDSTVRMQSNGQCRWKELDVRQDDRRCGLRTCTESTGQVIDYLFEIKADCAVYTPVRSDRFAGVSFALKLHSGKPAVIERRILNTVQPENKLELKQIEEAKWFDELLEENASHWSDFWRKSDVVIKGDELNQQGIRYCLFQLHQTYRGLDAHRNIGAKGLTGEAYNGHCFWDSETYCLPYYLLNDREAARSLVMYRFNTMEQAKSRALELDCKGACYPIATVNGWEACNLWQHASLQMQPSTAVAYAIVKYCELTGDDELLLNEGAQMLCEISRYVVSRGGWNADETGFGFWGVMGPDEFHMMVNNNFYTNFMGRKVLENTLKVLSKVDDPNRFSTPQERDEWGKIARCIIIHETDEHVFEQHDGYFTLPHLDIHSIPTNEFPLYEHWSYDRIYRTDMIKQPDVLMAMFLYPECFSMEQLRANYDYYEPRCIHESSLSPSIHAILAQRLGRSEEAEAFFSFATRMDLDNFNRNTTEGLHLTSIAAAWVTIVYGFGGLYTEGDLICIAPHLPEKWSSYSFRFLAGDGIVLVEVDENGCRLSMVEGSYAKIKLHGTLTEVFA